MHKKMVDEIIAVCRKRFADGDCAKANPFTAEQLEDAIIELAASHKTQQGSPSKSSELLCAVFLAPKHKGMMVSTGGLIGRIERGKRPDKLDRHLLGEMLSNMQEMASRFYSGDVKAVDAFLQCYCLDDKRPSV